MIDYKKLNNYLIGLLMKGKRVVYGEYKDKIMISDTYAVWFLDKEKVYINLQLCDFIPNFYNNFIPDDSIYMYTHVTDKLILSGKDKIRELKNEDFEIFINDKYLTFYKSYKVKSDTYDKPILLYNDEDDEDIIGLILPIKIF